jgi:hypothetical protein
VRKHNLFLLILACIALTNTSCYAQSIKGKIIGEDSLPVVGVSVYNSSSLESTISNENGIFEFANLNIGDTLLISHIGYQSQNIVVTNSVSLPTIYLESSLISLDDWTTCWGWKGRTNFS